MDTMILNIINGNLSDAKRQASRYRTQKIYEAMITDFGWSEEKAELGSLWVKGLSDFQSFCDAK